MSRTELYRIGKDAGEIGSTGNSWRGAMQVWTYIAKQYCGFDNFPMSFGETGTADQNKVWNAHTTHPLTDAEKIVLLSTMDRVVVSHSNIPKLLAAFREYGAAHADSSLDEQANVIANAEWSEGSFLAFNQTSVSEFWGQVYVEPENEDDEGEYVLYDPRTSTDHWELFE